MTSFINIVEEFQKPSVFLFVGKPRRGKSHFLKYLFHSNLLSPEVKKENKYNYGLVFCAGSSLVEYKGGFSPTGEKIKPLIPSNFCIEGYQEEKLFEFLDHLQSLHQKNKKLPRGFIIFDDLVGLLNASNKSFMNFITCYRKYNLDVYISIQYLKAIPPTIRECISFSFVFNTKHQISLKNIYESFASDFDSFDAFTKQFKKQTIEPHSCMCFIEHVINPEQNYFTIIAPKKLPNITYKF